MVQVWLALLGLMLAFGLFLAARGTVHHAPTAPAMVPSRTAKAPVPAPADALAARDGSTGTVALPALPIPPGAGESDGGPVAARPFQWGAASAIDRARAMQCLTAAIYYEAGGESVDGQRAVAQVVLNRVRHPAFPASVCGVVYQGVARARCQFSFACDGAQSRTPAIAGWSQAARIAAAALAGRVYAPVGLATHYHSFAVVPAWNRAMVMTDMVGAHLFHRWKGYWGTAAAMDRRYAGGETAPPPVTAIVTPEATMLPIPAPGATPLLVSTQPVPRQLLATPTPVTAPAISDRLARSGEILDKWKDSGRPIVHLGDPRPAETGAAQNPPR
jgi:hypothetical protein